MGSHEQQSNVRESVRRFVERNQNRPNKLTLWFICCLFVLFCGWRNIRHHLEDNPLRKITPVRFALGAFTFFILIIFVWFFFDRPVSNSETILGRLNRFATEWSILLYLYALVVPLLMWLLDKIDPRPT